jgi:hypothetical protein
MESFNADQFKQELIHFTGTESWYHYHGSKFTYTDGVRFVARELEAYWLLDLIFSFQHSQPARTESFQVWKLKLGEGSSATLILEDGDGGSLLTYDIPFTTFPLPDFTLWLTEDVLLLPSEY